VVAVVTGGDPARDAISDADGQFTIDRLASGEYRVLAEAAGFAPAELQRLAVPGPPAVLRLAGDGQAIVGRVLVGGAPAGGARVLLSGEGGAGPREAIAGQDGAFIFRGLGAGAYALRATKGTMASPVSAGVRVAAGRRGPMARDPVPVRLELASGGYLEGRVVDDAGGALPAATVRIEAAPEDPLPEVATAGRDGRFRVGPLPPAEYRLVPRQPGYVARGAVTVRVGADAAALVAQTLELLRGAAITGRVTDERGAPAAGVAVRCLAAGVEDLAVLSEPLPPAAEAAAMPPGTGRALGTTRAVRTDAAGGFAVDDLVPGRFRLEIARAGAVPLRTDELTVAPGQRRDAGTLPLRAGVVVSGRITALGVGPVGGARVAARRAQGDASVDLGLYAVTDGAGQFALALEPGRYTLAASADGLSDRTVDVQVGGPVAPPPLEIELRQSDARLEGVARDQGGRPLARARVQAWPIGAGAAAAGGVPEPGTVPLGVAVTDAGGNFSMARMPRASVLVEVSHPDYPRAWGPATPGTLAVVIVPIPGGIAGEVRERDGGVVVGRFRVEAVGPDGRTAQSVGRARGAGAFQLTRLAPGPWHLTVAAPGFRTATRDVDVPASATLGEPSVRDVRVDLVR
jgi:hypothetical protein